MASITTNRREFLKTAGMPVTRTKERLSWPIPLSLSGQAMAHRAAPQALPKIAPFSVADHYNRHTTRKPIICQYRKNSHLVNPGISAIYKKPKIWRRIQCPIGLSRILACFSGNMRWKLSVLWWSDLALTSAAVPDWK